MTSHREIMTNAARAVMNANSVLLYCQSAFGKGLEIVVGAYPGTEDESGIPGKENAPFLWIYAAGENEEVATDQSFTMHCVVGGCVEENGSMVISNVVQARNENQNGLVVNGGNAIVEALRDSCMNAIRDANAGAIVERMRKTENDLSHFPLEWAEFEVDYTEPEAL